MNTSLFLCPLCNKPGTRHSHRKACLDCVRQQQRRMWHARKARSIGGDEPLSVAAAGGWQAAMAADYLSRAWPLGVTV